MDVRKGRTEDINESSLLKICSTRADGALPLPSGLYVLLPFVDRSIYLFLLCIEYPMDVKSSSVRSKMHRTCAKPHMIWICDVVVCG